jgi:hypothetical protein
MLTNVSEERSTSVFRVEEQPSKKPECSRWLGVTVGSHTDYKIETYITTAVNLRSEKENIFSNRESDSIFVARNQ